MSLKFAIGTNSPSSYVANIQLLGDGTATSVTIPLDTLPLKFDFSNHAPTDVVGTPQQGNIAFTYTLANSGRRLKIDTTPAIGAGAQNSVGTTFQLFFDSF